MISRKDRVITQQLIRCAWVEFQVETLRPQNACSGESTMLQIELVTELSVWDATEGHDANFSLFLKCAIGSKKVLFQRSRICQQNISDALQHSLLRAAERNSCLLLFFMLGGRRKILNLAAEQRVNPFLSYLEKKIWRRRMVGTKCTNCILYRFSYLNRRSGWGNDMFWKRGRK